jgi:hypothetical protein
LLWHDCCAAGASGLSKLRKGGYMLREHARCRRTRGYNVSRTADDSEAVAVAAEELFEILEPRGAALKRRARRDDTKLIGVRRKTKSIEERTQQICYLRPRRAAVRVQLVHHEMEHAIVRALQPGAGLIEDGSFDRSHQHDIQHRVIRDQDVRIRGAYGLHAREMILWLNQLQHARDKNVVFVGVLERVVDEFNKGEWQLQMEGGKTGRELPGIVDQIITYQFLDFGDRKPVRGFVCTSPNPWGYPAKDRSGRLEQIEPPDLGKLLTKLTSKQQPGD